MMIWSKLRIILLAVTLGSIILVFVNVLQEKSKNMPKLEEYRSEAYIAEDR